MPNDTVKSADVYNRSWRDAAASNGCLSPTSVREATKGVEVVYYLRLSDDFIKIGTTHNLLGRLDQHRTKLGQFTVLALEFGGRDLERQRHTEFRHLRDGQREHFYPADDLLDHIDHIREALRLTT